MLRVSLVLYLVVYSPSKAAINPAEEWWRDSFIYQIYPRSFKDSNGDGVGDLNGITSKLEYLTDLNVSALWLSPIYVSPMVDFGYDIADFTDIDPIFGSLDDFTRLTSKAHTLGLKVILDFVPNHSSDKHPWFAKSIYRIKPYDDYYVWRDPKIVNGTRQPPNNWLSRFQGSAWQWNNYRQQYYLHQFAIEQPDLNYRSTALNQEIKNILSFWMDRGVNGFRIDTIYRLIEDSRFLDEPVIPYSPLPADDPDTLDHIYTKNQNETYDILRTWREHCDQHNGTKIILLTEAYTSIPLTMKYYEYGSNVPFNFMFMTELNNRSRPMDFKRNIDRWMNSMPVDYPANWVVGNHDNHRVATRFGRKRSDELSMLAAVLPGIAVIYNGDEIGMEDAFISFGQTVDPAGCNAGSERYYLKSRDPARTPFQWDNTTSAGFSTNNSTWLPVNYNYHWLNLAAQKGKNISHYEIFKKLVALKKNQLITMGSLDVMVNGKNILGIVRRLSGLAPVVLLINFSELTVVIDAATWLNIPELLHVYISSVYSSIIPDVRVNTTSLSLSGGASIILT